MLPGQDKEKAHLLVGGLYSGKGTKEDLWYLGEILFFKIRLQIGGNYSRNGRRRYRL